MSRTLSLLFALVCYAIFFATFLYLIGSTMDWREDDFAAGFVFENPNAKGACGCGESFTV